MQFRNRKGPRPQGGTHEGLALLLARLYRTFEPLGAGTRDVIALKAALDCLAKRHDLVPPDTLVSEMLDIGGFATPNDVLEQLRTLSTVYRLVEGEDSLQRAALGRIVIAMLRRCKADMKAPMAIIIARAKERAT